MSKVNFIFIRFEHATVLRHDDRAAHQQQHAKSIRCYL